MSFYPILPPLPPGILSLRRVPPETFWGSSKHFWGGTFKHFRPQQNIFGGLSNIFPPLPNIWGGLSNIFDLCKTFSADFQTFLTSAKHFGRTFKHFRPLQNIWGGLSNILGASRSRKSSNHLQRVSRGVNKAQMSHSLWRVKLGSPNAEAAHRLEIRGVHLRGLALRVMASTPTASRSPSQAGSGSAASSPVPHMWYEWGEHVASKSARFRSRLQIGGDGTLAGPQHGRK